MFQQLGRNIISITIYIQKNVFHTLFRVFQIQKFIKYDVARAVKYGGYLYLIVR